MKPTLIALAAIAMATVLPCEVRADEPERIFDARPNTAFVILDMRDVRMPDGREHLIATPTIGATIALPGGAGLAVRGSRKQLVEPVWQGIENRLTIGFVTPF